jgi:rhodanese-related sulfurtransferase
MPASAGGRSPTERLVSPPSPTAHRAATHEGVHEFELDDGWMHDTRTSPALRTLAELTGRPAGAEVISCCRGPYCVYADDAVRELGRTGFKAARLEDGYPEWKRAGLPTAVGD